MKEEIRKIIKQVLIDNNVKLTGEDGQVCVVCLTQLIDKLTDTVFDVIPYSD